ncbi:MAG: class I SAM-dependent methyltransferase [FCB group bacterium]|nr:class I SAM-dependent methyltransferase [FCB group bacterium]
MSDYWKQHWDQHYATSEYVYGVEPNQFLKDHARLIPKGKVLCVADGEGRNGVWLARQGYEITAIDYSREGLRKARRLAERFQVTIKLVEADLLSYHFGSEEYDGLVSIYSHFDAENRIKLHRNYAQALKPGGVLLLEAFSKEQEKYSSGGPKDIKLLYDEESLRASLPEMEIVLLREEIVTLEEGALHRGPAAVVRGIFRKPERPMLK